MVGEATLKLENPWLLLVGSPTIRCVRIDLEVPSRTMMHCNNFSIVSFITTCSLYSLSKTFVHFSHIYPDFS